MNSRNLSVTTSIIIICLVVFVVGLAVQRDVYVALPDGSFFHEKEPLFMLIGSYSWLTCFMEGEIWRIITYQFVHANFGHVLFNMLALYFFGPAVESIMGPRKFLLYYLVCGIAGALFSSFLASLGLFDMGGAALSDQGELIEAWKAVPMVGASAAVYGVMIAVAFLYPDMLVTLIFPPVTMKLRTLALVVISIACVVILFNFNNAGGEAGHLGGIIMGSIIMFIWKMRYMANRYRR